MKPSSRETYSVVIDGVKSEIETLDSFAIKFSLLTNVPITKIKHVIKEIPATLWRGQGEQRAGKLLRLVEEAGGRGRIVLEEKEPEKDDAAEPAATEHTSQGQQCRKCGFPLKESDKFCNFCMTPVGESSAPDERHADESKHEKIRVKATTERGPQIPPYRLLLYLVIVLIALLIGFAKPW